MSDEREPLWSDERIAKFTHTTYVVADVVAVIPIELMRNLITAVRDDYEARIAELEQERIALWHTINTQATYAEELEAQLAQTWQPVGHFKRACTCRDCRNLYGMENESLLTIQSGNNISNILSVVLPDDIRLCRLVEKGEGHE